MNRSIKIDDQKQIEQAAEAFARMLIKQALIKRDNHINIQINIKKYGKSN